MTSPHRRVWRLAGPIILSNLSVPLLGAVDTAVVGHMPDPAYVGAVAVGATIFNFLYWGFGFLRMGTTGFAAQAYGGGDREELAPRCWRVPCWWRPASAWRCGCCSGRSATSRCS